MSDEKFKYLTRWVDLHQALWVNPAHQELPHLDTAEHRYREAVALLEQRDRMLEDWLNDVAVTTGGLPQAWCATDGAVSDGSDPWGGAILTVAAGTMSPTGTALAVDVTVEMSFTVDATYEIEFSWTNSVNGETMAGWGWKEVVDVDTSSKFRQTWHCLVGAANLDADWELNAVVFGTNAVTFATEFRAIEVNAATEACCQWFTPE